MSMLTPGGIDRNMSRGFSVETLTGATPSWKTELNRSISAMEDGISGGLQHRHKTCYKKGGHHGRRACMVWKWSSPWGHCFWTGGLVYDRWQKQKQKQKRKKAERKREEKAEKKKEKKKPKKERKIEVRKVVEE